MKPQTREILDHLKAHGEITQRTAALELGCYRLAARILELRALGWEVETILEPNANGGRHARYVLEQVELFV